jgi:4-amino-4-deoxy-L-arabinose transferase-like glycosyltransferase
VSTGSPAVGHVAPAADRRPVLSGGRTISATVLGVGALTVLAAVLRFYGIGHQGFWFDEANSALLVRASPGRMLALIKDTESTPPLYYCIAWVWERLFGDGEAGLRSLSALAGTAVVPVAYAAGARLVSRRAGLITAALTACSPLLIWYSQEARSYELLVLLSALGLLAFAHARADPSPRLIGAWAAASALALTTHYYAVVAIVPEAILLLAAHRRRRAVQVAVAVVVVVGLALVPLALAQNSTGHDSWIATTPLHLRLAQIIPQFLIGTDMPARALFKDIAVLLALVALGLVAVSASVRRGSHAALLPGALALAGFVISLAFVAAGNDALITRNIIALWLPAAILLAGGLAAGGRRGAIGITVTAALCVIGIVATVGIAVDRNLQRPDWRPVSRVLGPGPTSGDRLILIQHYKTLLPLSLYQPRLAFLRSGAAHGVRELDVITMNSSRQPLCWWGAACNLISSQMQAVYRLPGFHELWLRHSHQFTIMRLVADRPQTVTPAEVASALHSTRLVHDDLIVQRS